MKTFIATLVLFCFSAAPALGQSPSSPKKPAAETQKTNTQTKKTESQKSGTAMEDLFKQGEQELKEKGRCKPPAIPVA